MTWTELRVPVLVEVVGLSQGEAGLMYRRAERPVRSGQSPDEVAVAVGEVPRGQAVVCHSTSWRWVAAGGNGPHLVVTYAVIPDSTAHWPLAQVQQVGVLCSETVEMPSPARIHEHHVVAHAVRHMADLAERDPGIAAAAQRHRQVWQAVRDFAAGVVTAAHDDLPSHAPMSVLDHRDPEIVRHGGGTDGASFTGTAYAPLCDSSQ